MSENLAIWEKVQTTPGEAVKPFDNGNFKGTSANATFNAKRATELFGPYGIGWWVEIEDETLKNLGSPEKPIWVHTLRIRLHYKHGDQEGVARGFGSTFASYQTKGGWLKVDDDYAKKSMTDAISKALQFMGFSADIWMGMWDDNKYVQERRDEFQETKRNGNDQRRTNGYQSKYVKTPPKKTPNDSPDQGPPPGSDDAPPCEPDDVVPDHGATDEGDGSFEVILRDGHKVGVLDLEEAGKEIAITLQQDDVRWFESEQILGMNDHILSEMPDHWRAKLRRISEGKREADKNQHDYMR